MAAPRLRPTMHLAYVLELVVAAAVCAAMVRDMASEPRARAHLAVAPSSEWVRLVGGTILTGLAIVGGAGLAIESARGRRPSTWGLGRWIWSISGVAAALNLATALLFVAATHLRQRHILIGGEVIPRVTRHYLASAMLSESAWTLAAVCITATFAQAPRDPGPDAREWLGRLYASVVIATLIGLRALQAMGR